MTGFMKLFAEFIAWDEAVQACGGYLVAQEVFGSPADSCNVEWAIVSVSWRGTKHIISKYKERTTQPRKKIKANIILV